MNLKFWKILSLSILQNMWKCVLNITLRMWLNNHLIRRLLWIWIGHFSQSQEWRWDYTTGQYYFVPKGAETQWKRKKKSFWIFIGWVNRAVWLWRALFFKKTRMTVSSFWLSKLSSWFQRVGWLPPSHRAGMLLTGALQVGLPPRALEVILLTQWAWRAEHWIKDYFRDLRSNKHIICKYFLPFCRLYFCLWFPLLCKSF